MSRRALLLAAVGFTAAGVAAPTAAAAADQPVQLSAKPVGQPGHFFDLPLAAGQTRELKVELGNHGKVPISARTYAANVYTIINGGFGAALHGAASGPTTSWLTYPTQVLTLQPGRATVRAFEVSVPPGTAPGEYITSLVLENDQPVKGNGAVALDQVVRQAVAVAVRVPGPLLPGLAIHAASHKVVAQRSAIAVAVSNTGNMRLTPTAKVVLHDSTGTVISRATVQMDSFYAHTDSSVEITLAHGLEAGAYSVDLILYDSRRNAHAETLGLPLTVVASPTTKHGSRSAGRQVIDVLQIPTGSGPTWLIVSAIAVFAALVVAVARRPRRRLSRAPLRSEGRRRRRAASARTSPAGVLTPAQRVHSPQQPTVGHVLPARNSHEQRPAAKHRGGHRIRS